MSEIYELYDIECNTCKHYDPMNGICRITGNNQHGYDFCEAMDTELNPMWEELNEDQINKDEEKEIASVIKREIYHLSFFACGSCGTVITDGDRFCRMCGKKMKWNDSDNNN